MSAPRFVPGDTLMMKEIVLWDGFLIKAQVPTNIRCFIVDGCFEDGSELLLGFFDDLDRACSAACDAARLNGTLVRLSLQHGGRP